jgi:hypothetical protein
MPIFEFEKWAKNIKLDKIEQRRPIEQKKDADLLMNTKSRYYVGVLPQNKM